MPTKYPKSKKMKPVFKGPDATMTKKDQKTTPSLCCCKDKKAKSKPGAKPGTKPEKK